MRRNLAVLAVLISALTLTTGCGDDADDAGNGSTSSSGNTTEDTTEPLVIEVKIKGESVTPNGERFDVNTGQEVQLDVTADAPGEIHVHSTPEQELEYDEGESTLTIEGMDRPGTVDVEVHDLDKVLVQLEVS